MTYNSSTLKQLVFKITGNSTNDGPGIRSVIFLKGCPLNCVWCHNPESKNAKAELWWDKERCIDCDKCIDTCPNGALQKKNSEFVNRALCLACFKCVKTCPPKSLSIKGNKMSVEEVVQEVITYKPFFDVSNGGVTISGGEPLLRIDTLKELLKRIKKEGIHILIETSGYFDLEKFQLTCLPYVDMIYIDLKIIDAAMHKELCGVSNETILENFIWLHQNSSTLGFDLLPRVPLIPEMTDTTENIAQIARFLKKQKVKKLALLPNNPMWFNKNRSLGLKDSFTQEHPVRKMYSEEKLLKIKDYFASCRIAVEVM